MENPNARLEVFCDGVFAIAITLLILEIKLPHENYETSADLWKALAHLVPSVLAFLLSFAIISITWVTHHNLFKLLDKTNPKFMYHNIYLLCTIVILPFPTAMLGEYVFTAQAAPAVVLYCFVNLIQSLCWILVQRIALVNGLCINNNAEKILSGTIKNGWYASFIYLICTIAAFWFPLTAACIITAMWIFWYLLSINLKNEKQLNN